jgi:hypothetical protein
MPPTAPSAPVNMVISERRPTASLFAPVLGLELGLGLELELEEPPIARELTGESAVLQPS